MSEKTCADCGQIKLVSEFNAHKATADGYETRCKECRARKVEEDRANRAFCAAIQKRHYAYFYPTPQYIYGLLDPRTGELRYIGHSHEPTKRLQTHAQKGSGENVRLREWITELQAAGLRPELQLLETVDENEFVLEREFRWIITGMREGMPLLNAEAHTGYGPQRNSDIIRHVAESPCVDFLTESRASPLLDAIGGWGMVKFAGTRWLHKPYRLREAIMICMKKWPDDLPLRLLPVAERMGISHREPITATDELGHPIRPFAETTLLTIMNKERDLEK